MIERTNEQKVVAACWNYLGTTNADEVSLHLAQYVRLATGYERPSPTVTYTASYVPGGAEPDAVVSISGPANSGFRMHDIAELATDGGEGDEC